MLLSTAILPSFDLGAQASTSPVGLTILYVGGMEPGNYSSIQDAIDNASNGDVVYVYSGIYYEALIVLKSITLVGEEKNTTVIDGRFNDTVISVTADGVFLHGFTIINGDYGIEIDSVVDCVFSDNVLLDLDHGVYITDSGNMTIQNNIIDSIRDTCIRLINSCNSTVCSNSLSDCHTGLDVSHCSNNSFSDNNLDNCSDVGIDIHASTNNNFSSHTINSSYISGIWISRSHNTIISGSLFTNNGAGIDIFSSNYSEVISNTFDSNRFPGVGVRNSYETHISHNYMVNSSTFIEGSVNTSFINNTAGNNSGIYARYSMNNTIVGNTGFNDSELTLLSSNNSYLANNLFYNNSHGIEVEDSTDISIINNTAHSNWGGIGLYSCTDSLIKNNSADFNSRGISFTFSNNVLVLENIVSGNDKGIRSYESTNSTIKNNLAVNNSYGCSLDYGYNVSIISNILSENEIGLFLYHSCNNTIDRNKIHLNNQTGIHLSQESNNNTIVDSVIDQNKDFGILIECCANNTICENMISNNIVGVQTFADAGNCVYLNNLIGNTQNALGGWADGDWDNGRFGNYWDDYKNHSHRLRWRIWRRGIWSHPYENYESGVIDYYPLIVPHQTKYIFTDYLLYLWGFLS